MNVVTGRSQIATTYGIVAASQPLAARAGVQVLERGGTAVDAAIATNAVLGLVEPYMNGIGGDLFAILSDREAREPRRAPTALLGVSSRSKPEPGEIAGIRARPDDSATISRPAVCDELSTL